MREDLAQPEILLLDKPLGAMDGAPPTTIWREQGVTMILATREAVFLAGRVLVILREKECPAPPSVCPPPAPP